MNFVLKSNGYNFNSVIIYAEVACLKKKKTILI